MAKRRLPIKAKKQNLTPVWIIFAVVAAVIALFVYRGLRDLSGDPILRSQDDIPRLTASEAVSAIEQNGAILLDVRQASQYEINHIKGAISIPLGEIEAYLPGLDKEAWYITYCT